MDKTGSKAKMPENTFCEQYCECLNGPKCHHRFIMSLKLISLLCSLQCPLLVRVSVAAFSSQICGMHPICSMLGDVISDRVSEQHMWVLNLSLR